ncbi:von Willebrand factor type A domain-containing protein [Oribacterium sp. KHPX15]|uniref:vWA domain-containing protein n=1 Tax=unclassified Oribacterium TaxID=2629782 RepID=UPI0004E196DF|nr:MULTISPECIES: vWA domain-containing protein [unclassified Oribacterium]SDZ95535.1 von Willebrand factor type A domain-containing protein [Oribacterium sp. KHPX15]
MGSNYKIKYNVDMVFCIDVTGSMDHIIKIVQNNALNLYQDVKNCMEQKGKHIDTLRVRIIAFRDYLADNEDAMLVTDFFRLPEDAEKLKKCVGSLVAKGGGDDPEDGLEALAYAIRSKWNTENAKKRHVIVLWTDDDAHELGFGKDSEYYPKGMASDIRELTSWWGDAGDPGYMDQEAKRLVLFAPDMQGWKQVSDNWDKVLHYPSEAGDGLKDAEYGQIISVISQTI